MKHHKCILTKTCHDPPGTQRLQKESTFQLFSSATQLCSVSSTAATVRTTESRPYHDNKASLCMKEKVCSSVFHKLYYGQGQIESQTEFSRTEKVCNSI